MPTRTEVQQILAALKRVSSRKTRDEMKTRYGIVAPKSFGVKMSAMQKISKQFRTKDAKQNHALADALWKTGWYEARMVACMIDDAALVTPAQMDRWCRDFDNWGIVDTVCFKLFDQSPHALAKVKKWATAKGEFQKRAAFALLACVALHSKTTSDNELLKCLPLIDAAASDKRNFVKKGVNWAVRSLNRRGPKVRAALQRLSQIRA